MDNYSKPKWDYRIEIVNKLICVLYDIPSGAGTGGCCHIVTDDDNIDDDDLKWVINYCESDGKDREDAKLSKLICEYLLELSYEQRVLLFALKNSDEHDITQFLWDGLPNGYCETIVERFEGD